MAPFNRTGEFANWVGWGIVTFLCIATAYLIVIISQKILPNDNLSLITGAFGFFTAKLSTVVDWCFGSNSGSKTKDDTISTAVNTASAAQAALAPIKPPDVTLSPGETAVIATDPELTKE